jgi:hypothetical protein
MITNGGADIVYNPDPGGSVLPLDYEVNGHLTGDQVTFQYAVEDSLGGTDSNTVTITETPVADPPMVATSNVTNTIGATSFVMTATSDDYNHDNGEVRGSDYINPVTFTLSSGLAAGTLSGAGLVNDGGGVYTLNGGAGDLGLLSDNLSFSAPGGAFGTITIAATADETEGAGNPKSATTTTTQTIDIPTANPFATTVNEDQPSAPIPVSDFATDPSGAPLTIAVTQPQYGSVTILNNGTANADIVYNPDGGVLPLDWEVNGQPTNDQVSFGYTVTNALGGTNANAITVNETPVADTPRVVIGPPAPGALADQTLITITATSGDFGTATAGSDFIQSLGLSNLPPGVTLSDSLGLLNPATNVITTTGEPGTLNDTITVTTPADTSENFNLGIDQPPETGPGRMLVDSWAVA